MIFQCFSLNYAEQQSYQKVFLWMHSTVAVFALIANFYVLSSAIYSFSLWQNNEQ